VSRAARHLAPVDDLSRHHAQGKASVYRVRSRSTPRIAPDRPVCQCLAQQQPARAGVVGIISLTESRAATLIGVFISVTTIPAAADIGLSLSYGSWQEARGSFFQLLLNVTILIVVGMIMLVVQKRTRDRVTPLPESLEQ